MERLIYDNDEYCDACFILIFFFFCLTFSESYPSWPLHAYFLISILDQ